MNNRNATIIGHEEIFKAIYYERTNSCNSTEIPNIGTKWQIILSRPSIQPIRFSSRPITQFSIGRGKTHQKGAVIESRREQIINYRGRSRGLSHWIRFIGVGQIKTPLECFYIYLPISVEVRNLWAQQIRELQSTNATREDHCKRTHLHGFRFQPPQCMHYFTWKVNQSFEFPDNDTQDFALKAT